MWDLKDFDKRVVDFYVQDIKKISEINFQWSVDSARKEIAKIFLMIDYVTSLWFRPWVYVKNNLSGEIWIFEWFYRSFDPRDFSHFALIVKVLDWKQVAFPIPYIRNFSEENKFYFDCVCWLSVLDIEKNDAEDIYSKQKYLLTLWCAEFLEVAKTIFSDDNTHHLIRDFIDFKLISTLSKNYTSKQLKTLLSKIKDNGFRKIVKSKIDQIFEARSWKMFSIK